MKLIISGGTGLVGTELIRQGLELPQIRTLVVLSRKPVSVPANADSSKLKQVLISDYTEYPENVRKELAGADACIWTVAITPSKSKMYDFAEVRRICHTSTIAGFQAMIDSELAKPFRFVYMSGAGIDRDQAKQPSPSFMAPYMLMRGETEASVLGIAQRDPNNLAVAVVRPGIITSQVNVVRSIWGAALHLTNLVTNITVQEVAAAMLHQATNGFVKETLSNEDLKHIGREALAKQQS